MARASALVLLQRPAGDVRASLPLCVRRSHPGTRRQVRELSAPGDLHPDRPLWGSLHRRGTGHRHQGRDHRSHEDASHGPLGRACRKNLRRSCPQRARCGPHARRGHAGRLSLHGQSRRQCIGRSHRALFRIRILLGIRLYRHGREGPGDGSVGGIHPHLPAGVRELGLRPRASMPGWLQAWANHQPVSIAVNSARALFSGQPAWHFVWQLLAWAVAILVVFVPLSVWQYRRM